MNGVRSRGTWKLKSEREGSLTQSRKGEEVRMRLKSREPVTRGMGEGLWVFGAGIVLVIVLVLEFLPNYDRPAKGEFLDRIFRIYRRSENK